jgi:hypothetical protein
MVYDGDQRGSSILPLRVFENENKSVYFISHSSIMTCLCGIKGQQNYGEEKNKEFKACNSPGKDLFSYYLLYYKVI